MARSAEFCKRGAPIRYPATTASSIRDELGNIPGKRCALSMCRNPPIYSLNGSGSPALEWLSFVTRFGEDWHMLASLSVLIRKRVKHVGLASPLHDNIFMSSDGLGLYGI